MISKIWTIYNEEIEDPADRSKTITTVLDLPKSRKARIRLFQGYVAWIGLKGTAVEQTLTGWQSITLHEFDKYRVSPYSRVPSTITPSASLDLQANVSSAVKQFKRGVKHDIHIYEDMQDSSMQFDPRLKKTLLQKTLLHLYNIIRSS
jgi:hypothetical protein